MVYLAQAWSLMAGSKALELLVLGLLKNQSTANRLYEEKLDYAEIPESFFFFFSEAPRPTLLVVAPTHLSWPS